MRDVALRLVGAAGILWAVANGAAAQAATANDYNVFAAGNFTSNYTEVNGALAVGGNASVNGFSVGNGLSADYTGDSLVVGGNLAWNNGQVFHGNALVGGSIAGSGFTVLAPGTKTAHAAVLPVDFSGEVVRLKDLAADLGTLDANGTTSDTDGLRFTGTNASVNVFDVSTAQLAGASHVDIVIPTGSVALFNVSGSSYASNWMGFTVNDVAISPDALGLASSLLFNFEEANSLTINGSWAGSMLAPNADVALNWGGFYGSLAANNIASTSEFYDVRFNGYARFEPVTPPVTTPVPEPASWLMMIAGFGLAGAALRRRRVVEGATATA